MKIFKYLVIIVLVVIVLYFKKDILQKHTFSPKTTNQDSKNVEIVVTNLNIPWEVVFLPDGDMLVTERGGKLLRVENPSKGEVSKKIIAEIQGVKHIGEGGLLGMALDPNFKSNKFIYLYSTTDEKGGITNRVERYKFKNDALSDRSVILEGIKGSPNHDGGRIAFGPDGYLYVTTGDVEIPTLAQDKNSLNGKILRIKSDGSIPNDNPFGNAVYSMGHRNPQGLTWDKDGNLWETEHGPSGSQTGNDEVNRIVKGGNYGWPDIRGEQTKNGMIPPIIESGRDTWAPAGLAYHNGNLYFTGLRGQALYTAKIESSNKQSLTSYKQSLTSLTLSESFKKEFGRLRVVVVGPDNYLYVATSNTDGRGSKKDGDDKIIKILR